MSDFTLRDSLEVQFTKAPAIAIAGASGSGKTESAMRLARGWSGSDSFAVIDTEEKRALYKKDRHQPWQWMDLQPPFSPERVWGALAAVKHFPAVILDSGTHEYAGEGGISDIQEETLDKMCKGDPSKAERLSGPAWKDAKRRHKRELMANLIRYPTLLIVCLRAEPKVKFVKVDGKTQIVDAGFQPICEKMFMYEMLASFMMYAERPGIPEQVKALEQDLRPIFLLDRPIDEDTGRRLRAWADSRAPKPSAQPKPDSQEQTFITAEQVAQLRAACGEGVEAALLEFAEIASLSEIAAADFDGALRWVKKRKPAGIEDEAVALRRIDTAQDDGAAAAILDLCKSQPWYPRAVAAYKERFQQQ